MRTEKTQTHLIEQDRQESQQEQQHDAEGEAPMRRRILQERCRVVERHVGQREHHAQDLHDGRLDDDGDKDAVARGGPRRRGENPRSVTVRMRTTTSRRARISHARSGCGKRRGTEVTPGDAQRPTSVQRRA